MEYARLTESWEKAAESKEYEVAVKLIEKQIAQNVVDVLNIFLRDPFTVVPDNAYSVLDSMDTLFRVELQPVYEFQDKLLETWCGRELYAEENAWDKSLHEYAELERDFIEIMKPFDEQYILSRMRKRISTNLEHLKEEIFDLLTASQDVSTIKDFDEAYAKRIEVDGDPIKGIEDLQAGIVCMIRYDAERLDDMDREKLLRVCSRLDQVLLMVAAFEKILKKESGLQVRVIQDEGFGKRFEEALIGEFFKRSTQVNQLKIDYFQLGCKEPFVPLTCINTILRRAWDQIVEIEFEFLQIIETQ